jgi:hypothetical protein
VSFTPEAGDRQAKPTCKSLGLRRIGRIQIIARQGDEILSGAQVTLPILDDGVLMVVEELIHATFLVALTARPLQKLCYAAMTGSCADCV